MKQNLWFFFEGPRYRQDYDPAHDESDLPATVDPETFTWELPDLVFLIERIQKEARNAHSFIKHRIRLYHQAMQEQWTESEKRQRLSYQLDGEVEDSIFPTLEDGYVGIIEERVHRKMPLTYLALSNRDFTALLQGALAEQERKQALQQKQDELSAQLRGIEQRVAALKAEEAQTRKNLAALKF